MTPKIRSSRTATYWACLALLALSACGGGGGGGGGLPLGLLPPPPPPAAPPPPAPPGPVSVNGKVVVLGPIGNAVVCVDRNANGACDAGEPASGKTAADGQYRFSYTPTDAADAAKLAAAPLLARIVPGAVAAGGSYESDGSGTPVPLSTRAYHLGAPASLRAQINPLTTLVQAAIATGIAADRARALVAAQLGIPAAGIADYQDLAVGEGFADDARTAAGLTNLALHAGATLAVVDPAVATAPAPGETLARLEFTNPSTYYLQTYSTDGVVSGQGRTQVVDRREGKTAGVAIAHGQLYRQVRLSPTGWLRCDETTDFFNTQGLPNRTEFCGGSVPSLAYTLSQDIAGRKMSEVVAQMQAATDGSNTIVGLDPSVGLADPGATFPAGSLIRTRFGIDVKQFPLINDVTTDAVGFATLEALIAGRPVGGVNLANGGGTASLGLAQDDRHILRVAFVDASTVRYYICDWAQASSTMSNCIAGGTGGFRIATVNGARLIELDAASYPSTYVDNRRSFGEYGGAVYMVRQVKPQLQYNARTLQRLNGPAWQALKRQIGL